MSLQKAVDEGQGALTTLGFYNPSKKERRGDNARGELRSGAVTGDCDGSTDREDISRKCEELCLEEDGCEDGEEDDNVNSDDEGWITPENLQQVCEEMGGVLEELTQSLAVGCITTDFAMQVSVC